MSWKFDSDLVDVANFDCFWGEVEDVTWVEERADEELREEGLEDEEGFVGGRDDEYDG
jgi:hypothetical protein